MSSTKTILFKHRANKNSKIFFIVFHKHLWSSDKGSIDWLIIHEKRGTVCPHLQAEGRQNYPNDKDDFEQFHATIREAAMSSSIIRVWLWHASLLKNFAMIESF